MLRPSGDPDLLVGFDTADDAAVYRISDDIAVVSTVDFITPPVDDPHWFGRIAAANSISDIYAMGARPLIALSLVMFPSEDLDMGVLKEILRGAGDKVNEAGAVLAGGHSVDDKEPKFGLAVTGVVHPGRVVTNCGAKEGDSLLLTKPLGTGVLFNACRSGKLPFRELEPLLTEVASLNNKACEVASRFDLHACTDVTGFGIIGHTLEIAKGSCVRIDLHYDRLPLYPNAVEMYRKGETTRSNRPNREFAEGGWQSSVGKSLEEELLFDPQTSGGLILVVPAAQAEDLEKALKQAGVHSAAVIGEVVEGGSSYVRVV